ncbi:subunit p30 of RNase P [Chloropicon primus]|uniref:Subunit p30 of RNase P n=1 Tax=Chloropicon primus TaxID=1764295 RepID=A0A5B8MUQ4_9CHLO|nr:subunit p30 of RNase P [Chloropicon primus]UPR02716.1 subunit p30 of RNase P [Chloropicon primus]|mmetsp:Transcript_11051/g.30907  ORF Transcript_11051/g.30907 Transcript_11051/m.30907 type:complete len:254 (-) Transcript_11051:86-847(-)|eukprot:QDZ23504.1 subunit p30 of RNase P [Chloropicon primus]
MFDLHVGSKPSEAFVQRAESLGYKCIARVHKPSEASGKEDAAEDSCPADEARLKVLRRVNLGASWEAVPKFRQAYDLVGVEFDGSAPPETFKRLCEKAECDIITLDLSKSQLAVHLQPATVQAALKRGLVFEILYSPVLVSEETRRRNIFSNAKLLVRSTRGRGLVLSSGTGNPLDLRSPLDVANLATLFGLKPAQAKVALEGACKDLVEKARAKKVFKRGFHLREKSSEEIAQQREEEEKLRKKKKPKILKY